LLPSAQTPSTQNNGDQNKRCSHNAHNPTHQTLPATKRTRFSTTPLWLHETNRPPNVTLNPPTPPMATPPTPTFDDYAPYTAHGDVRQAPTTTTPKPRPFSPLDMLTQLSHLASPQTPHLVPPLLSDPPAPHFASPQTPLLVPPLLSNPPALKHTRPVSLPPASYQHQDAMRTDAASAAPLEAHDGAETMTKKPRHQVAHDKYTLSHHTSPSKEHLARPANWDSMTRTTTQARNRGTKQS
jgi:hypothetical protein